MSSEDTEPSADVDPESVIVQVAWARVMREVGKIAKAQRNKDQNFNFRGIDDVVNTVAPVLRRHGVFIVPESVIEIREERYETNRGTKMHGVITHEEWRVWGPAGDSFTMQSVGQSSDAGDKAVSKAESVAYRVVLLQSLCIPTDETDPDATAHERGGGSRQDEPLAFESTEKWLTLMDAAGTVSELEAVVEQSKPFRFSEPDKQTLQAAFTARKAELTGALV